MLIDWFTVFAQVVNFLILVALLKKFLYSRVTAAMDERAGEIAERFVGLASSDELARALDTAAEKLAAQSAA